MPTKLVFDPYIARQFPLGFSPFDYKNALFAYSRLLLHFFKTLFINFLFLQCEPLLLDVELTV